MNFSKVDVEDHPKVYKYNAFIVRLYKWNVPTCF